MTDQNLDVGTLNEDNSTANTQAVTTAPATDKLYLDKFTSKEELIKGTVELATKLGSSPTPDQIIDWSTKSAEDVVLAYKGLERQFHSGSPKQDNSQDVGEVDKYLDEWAKKNGFVKKQELEAQKYEETELNSYLAQRPDAKSRLDLIKRLANTEGFKDKSYAEVDAFITKSIGTPARPETKPTRSGGRVASPTKSLDDMSDDEFAQSIGAFSNDKTARIRG